MSLKKRLQFTIHIIQMENKIKKLVLKSINILRSMIQMIQRRMTLLHNFKWIFLPASGEKITRNNLFKMSPKLKIQVVFVATCCRNIISQNLFKNGRQLNFFIISSMIQQLTKWCLSLAHNNIHQFQCMCQIFGLKFLCGAFLFQSLIFMNMTQLEGSWRSLKELSIKYQFGGTYQFFFQIFYVVHVCFSC